MNTKVIIMSTKVIIAIIAEIIVIYSIFLSKKMNNIEYGLILVIFVLFIFCIINYIREYLLVSNETKLLVNTQSLRYSNLLSESTIDIKEIDFNYSPKHIEFLKFGVGSFFILGLLGSLFGLSNVLDKISSSNLDLLKNVGLLKNVFYFSILGVLSGLIIEYLVQDLYKLVFEMEQVINNHVAKNVKYHYLDTNTIASLITKPNLKELLDSVDNFSFSDKLSITNVYLNNSMLREYISSKKFVEDKADEFTLRTYQMFKEFLNEFNNSVNIVKDAQVEIKNENVKTLNTLSKEITNISNIVNTLDSSNRKYIEHISENNKKVLEAMDNNLFEQKHFIITYKESINNIQNDMKSISHEYNKQILDVHKEIYNQHQNINHIYAGTNSDIIKTHENILSEHIKIRDFSMEISQDVLSTHNEIKQNHIETNNQISESHKSIKDKYVNSMERFIKIFIDLSNDLKIKNTQNSNNIRDIVSKYSEVGEYFNGMFKDINLTISNEQSKLMNNILSNLKTDSQHISQASLENINNQIKSMLLKTDEYVKMSIDKSFNEITTIQNKVNESIDENNKLNSDVIEKINYNLSEYQIIKKKSEDINKDISSSESITRSMSNIIDKVSNNQMNINKQINEFENKFLALEDQSKYLQLSEINQKLDNSKSIFENIIKSHVSSFEKMNDDINQVSLLEKSLEESNNQIKSLNNNIKGFANNIESKVNSIENMTKALDVFGSKVKKMELQLIQSNADKEVRIENP